MNTFQTFAEKSKKTVKKIQVFFCQMLTASAKQMQMRKNLDEIDKPPVAANFKK